MKHKRIPVMLLLCLLLAACKKEAPVYPAGATTHAPATAATATESTVPTAMPSAIDTTAPIVTEPVHSPLYIPGIAVEDIIQYFNEVCMNAEFVNSGDATLLQKWVVPIRYMVYGEPTNDDLATLSRFVQWLNTIDGFPGITETADPEQTNLRIYFCAEDELISRLGDNFYGTDGGVTFWYMENAIYDAIICCRTDLRQELRNSVILEELYNGLGPIQDTDLRPDSIIYSGYSDPQALTSIDELLLRLLYHPEMQCGLNTSQCEDIIRKLYY